MNSAASMKNYLSSSDVVIWLVLIAGKLVLCLSVFKTRLLYNMPWFSVYVLTSTAKSVLLLITAFQASYTAYYYAFYFSGYLQTALAFLTLVECGRRVLPGLELPQKEKAFTYLFAVLAVVVIFVSLWPLRSPDKRFELGAYLGVAVSFIFVAAYSHHLGLYWSRLVAGISFSLGLLYLVDGAAKAMIGHYPSAMVLFVRQLSQIANLLAVVAWIIVVLSPWGEHELTEQSLEKIETAFARIEAGLEAERVETL